MIVKIVHQLPNLNYTASALEPHIDGRTMEIHHGKHHQTYINNLNAVLESESDLLEMPVDDLIKNVSELSNNGSHGWSTLFA